ncbi:FERM and PDZ domain-containing protein 1 [Mobula hypostoma]|uniref:FERM and PDZ domain-containing protein 1 n=1 Tax=Mobula hypostoma TaxID=723540 RepID=UPI002FC37B09
MFAGVKSFTRILVGVKGFMWILAGVRRFTWIPAGVKGFTCILAGVKGFTCILGGLKELMWILAGVKGLWILAEGPKSSFITDEKRARLKSNPVKVRFAEEVIVNGHTQGNSLLFMPNVLKVYLENGQTKAFRYDKNTTVKDIILTLKSKLSICCIEYFALALKERYSVTKVYLLHDDEVIEQVVQKREPHDYKCLFRVCFLPRDPLVVLQDDPVTFDYLYLQSCNDVLQEKFAVEMKCSTAIRLAALQIQECILSSKQSQKISMKYIEKDWGIENFVSPTILHNMKEKDVRKAINYHLKNNQSLIPPGQKHLISPTQLRLNYLNMLSNLRTYGGKTFHATLMLQDRESFITLLVGAKYGISQIINSKLNIMNQLTNFNNIRKLELTFECDRISMVNIYLEDMKSLSLLLESHHAKDLVCSIAGYYKLYVNSRDSIFTWPGNDQAQLPNTEEGDEARGLSDSESLSDMDSSVEMSVHRLRNGFIQPLTEADEDDKNSENEATDSDYMQEDILEETSCSTGDVSDFNDEISQGGDTCERSCSADSLEELQMETSMSSLSGLHSYDDSSEEDDKNSAAEESEGEPSTSKQTMESEIRVPQLSTESPISTQPFAEYSNSAMKELVTCHSPDLSLSTHHSAAETWNQHAEVVDGSDTQGSIACALIQYSMVTELPPIPSPVESTDDGDASGEFLIIPILDPPLGFRDSSSEDEFFDAAERFTTFETPDDAKITEAGADLESACMKRIEEKWNVQTSPSRYEITKDTEHMDSSKDKSQEAKPVINSKERFTPKDAFDVKPYLSHCYSKKAEDYKYYYDRENLISRKQQLSAFSSVVNNETESALLEPELISPLKSISVCINKKAAPNLMEMEPDTMEIKSVTEAITVITPVSAMRYPCDSGSKMGNPPLIDGLEQDESVSKSFIDVEPPRSACSKTERSSGLSEVILELGQLCLENPIEDTAVTQESSAVHSVCPSAKLNNLSRQEEEELGLNVDSEKLAILTTDTTKQLSTSGKEACSCQMVYGNCFRALGIDANDEHKELESLTRPLSPKTTPPASGSPLPQGLATFNKQGEETIAAKCYFGILDAVKDGNLVLPLFKDKRYNMPNGFRLVQNDVVELLNVLKECPRESHTEEDCTALTSVARQKLDRECRKLMSACQKSVKVNQTPDEMILGVSESFQALSQLSETCFQLTTCLRCAKDHAEVASTLRKVVMTYKIFVQASENACGKMSDDLSMKLLAEQCASLFTDIFCLNQLFTSISPSQ